MNDCKSSFVYASISSRFIAYCIDLFCVFLLSCILYFLIQVFSFFIGILNWSDFVSRNWYYFALPIFVFVSSFYFVFFPISSISSTFGQLLLGIKQVDKNGNHLSFFASSMKFLATLLSKILYIGYIFVYFNAFHQTLHEKITNTYLVQR